MRWLIILLVSVLVLSDVLGMSMSLGPGLSVKNAILYCLALALMARLILSDAQRVEMPAVLVAFVILISYAIFSWLAASFVISYPRYDAVASGINLKAQLIDPALFFFSAFYALRTSADVRVVLKAFLLAVTAANFFTLTDVAGLTDFGVRIGERGAEAGRVFGVFGHANETAGLIVCLLPGVAALALSSRGIARLCWWAAALISLSVLIMTVSRGAFVAAGLGTLWAMYVCRRSIPVGLFMRGAAIAGVSVVVVLVLVSVLNPSMGSILADRLLGESTAMDIDDASSGRTAIWSAAISRMMGTPLTLITGFGWDSYASMPFQLATHNYYLGLWFELGIPGLALFVFIIAYVIGTARKALDARAAELRPYLIAFLFGIFPLTIAICFGNLSNPWPYVWIYIGIAMRAAMLTLGPQRQAVPLKRDASIAREPAVRLDRRST
jgi:O-antigen ligase